MPRRTTAAALALLAVLAGAERAQAARSDDLAKPVVLVSGPDTPGNGCTVWNPLMTELRGYRGKVDAKPVKFRDEVVRITWGRPSGCADVTVLEAGSMTELARKLAERISNVNAMKGPVDVVAHGVSGLALRLALAGGTNSATAIPMAVEDAVTVGTAHDGSAAAAGACGGHPACAGADPAASADVFGFLKAKAMDPQGTGGTDWSAFGFGGDRQVSGDNATAMDAAHKTIYVEDKYNRLMALGDTDAEKRDAKIRYLHAGGEWTAWNKAPHVVQRVADDLVRGAGESAGGGQGAYAKGCTGFTDGKSGETLMKDPQLPKWLGEPGDVRVVKFGNLDAVATCFRKDGDKFTSTGPTRVNGVDLEPAPQTLVVIDTKKKTITAKAADVSIPVQNRDSKLFPDGNFVLIEDYALDWRIPEADGPVVGDEGRLVSLPGLTAKFLGQKLKSGFVLNVVKGGVQLDATLALPGMFSGTLPRGTAYKQQPECSNGDDDDKDGKSDLADDDCKTRNDDYENSAEQLGGTVTVGTSNTEGLRIEKAGIALDGGFRVGAIRYSGGATFDYSRADDEWKASVKASLPALGSKTFLVRFAFKEGKLSTIYGEGSGLDVPLPWGGLFLQRLGLGLTGLGQEGKDIDLLIGLGVTWLRRIPLAPVEVDGDAQITLGTPFKFKLSGKAKLVEQQMAGGSFEYEQDNGVKLQFTLGKEYELGPVKVLAQGQLDGAIGGVDSLDLTATTRACVSATLLDPVCVPSASHRISKYAGKPFTWSFCAQVPLGTKQYGVGYVLQLVNGKTNLRTVMGACDVHLPHVKGDGAQAGGERGFTVARGTPSQVVSIGGRGSSPVVTLVAPDGRRIVVPADRGGVTGEDFFVLRDDHANETFVLLHEPAPGRWVVEAQPGSPAVTGVRTADVRRPARVAATLRPARRGGARELRYRVDAEPGTEVRFVERGAGGLIHELGRARGARGTLRVRPQHGRAGRRDVMAVVLADGVVVTERKVASLTYAPPRLGRVRGVRFRRTGRTVVVTWRGAAGAGRYAVETRLPDGRSGVREQRGRRLVLRELRADGPVRVRIVPLARVGQRQGPATVARGGAVRRG